MISFRKQKHINNCSMGGVFISVILMCRTAVILALSKFVGLNSFVKLLAVCHPYIVFHQSRGVLHIVYLLLPVLFPVFRCNRFSSMVSFHRNAVLSVNLMISYEYTKNVLGF